MRNIKVFAEEVKVEVEKLLTDVTIQVHSVVKNNGVEYTGLTIRKTDENIAPTIYLNEMFDYDISAGLAAKEVIGKYREAKIPQVDLSFYKEFDKVKDQVKVKLVNASNEQYLGISAEEYGFADLKLVPFVQVDLGSDKGTIHVKEEHIRSWNVTVEEMVKIGLENIRNDLTVLPLENFIMGNREPAENMLPGFNVITNKDQMYGAVQVIAAKDYIEEVYNNGYVVIPSSIHEVIIMPSEIGAEAMGLKMMIKDVNSTMLSEEEILSDNYYEITA